MAETVKIVQSRPGAATLTALYAVPASTKFAGQLFIMNDTTAAIGGRVSIQIAGAADAAAQYLLGGNTNSASVPGDGYPVVITGIMLGATDELNVYSVTAGLVFNLVGVEIS